MSSVFERLRRALAPGIELERELASGGMGIVFVGRDTVLDRRIAVKVLKPELATAIGAERFLLEARSAARLSHPNVVRVYSSGIGDGLLYFTMELIPGETLESRLAGGRLSAAEAVSLVREVLAALEAAHRLEIVHRDIKPSNIFLDGGRAKLGDFGIARVRETDTPTLTAPGQRIGTLLYMSPEQLRGEPVTKASDVYSTGLVLFEACSGRHWIPDTPPSKGDWTDVPPALRTPLRKALQLRPEERWPDAASFAEALPAERVPWRALLGATLVLAALIYLLWHLPIWDGRSRLRQDSAYLHDLVLFPFATDGLADSAPAASLSRATEWYFLRLPSLGIERRAPAARRWAESSLPPARRLAELTTAMQSRYGAQAVVGVRGAMLKVEVSVVNGRGESILHAEILGDSADYLALGDQVGARILAGISPGLPPPFRRGGAIIRVRSEAALEFLRGEAASERDAWLPAEKHYATALALDSTFVLAAWRLGNARRWMPLRSTPPFPPDFLSLFRAHADNLTETDRHLVEAQFAPSGEPRFTKYEEALRTGHGDAYVMLLYGDELFHRGPLSGRSLDTAARMLADATAADPTLAPAWEHLAWALIRLGRRAAAARALEHLDRVAGGRMESEIYLPEFLHLAYTARFDPSALGTGSAGLLGTPSNLALAARGALAFDLPDAELAFGRALASLDGASPALRASGRIAQGVALVALGRPVAALGAIDTAAMLFADPAEARLQAAEWRVIPAALGFPGIPAVEVERGRHELAALADRPDGARAAWALGVDAFARRETASGLGWREVLAIREPDGGPLGPSLAAMAAASGGDPARALSESERGLALDSAGLAPDPFFRAVLHLQRGEWLRATDRPEEADRSWLWYENTDAVGWPQAEAQAAEVDWALSSWARLRRAALASGTGRRDDACALTRRLLEIWSRPEPATAAVADSLRASAAGCPP